MLSLNKSSQQFYVAYEVLQWNSDQPEQQSKALNAQL